MGHFYSYSSWRPIAPAIRSFLLYIV